MTSTHNDYDIKPPSNSCYSNLACYGAYGRVRHIQTPTPSGVVPQIFNKLGPGHALPANEIPNREA